MRRAFLLTLALGVLTLAPTASLGASQTANLTGTIALVNGGVRVTVTNNGPDRTTYVWIRLAGGVQHTGAPTTGAGGGCGPGPDAVTVECGYGLPSSGFLPGESREITIMTDRAYPAGGGAQLFWGETTNGPLIAAGSATGPGSPSSSPAGGGTIDPCTCTALIAKIVPSSIRIVERHPLGGQAIVLKLRWTMTCDTGDGECSATLRMTPPRGRTYRMFLDKPVTPVTCEGDCGETTSGTVTHVLHGENLEPHDRASIGTVPIVVQRTCKGRGKSLPPIRLSIAFKSNGTIDRANSKLG